MRQPVQTFVRFEEVELLRVRILNTAEMLISRTASFGLWGGLLSKLTGHSETVGLERRPEVARDNSWVQRYLYTRISSDQSAELTLILTDFCAWTCWSIRRESVMSRNMTSQTCKAASPKRTFKISMFLRCDVVSVEYSRYINDEPHTSLVVTILHRQQPLREKHLQLLDRKVLGVVYAD